jgi:hypothetical protein
MKRLHRFLAGGLVLGLGLFLTLTTAQAYHEGYYDQTSTRFGIRGGTYTDPDDAFLGAEALVSMGSSFYFNPNVEYVFMRGNTFLTMNADFHVDVARSDRVFFWLGAGLAGLYNNPDGPIGGDLKAGANLFFGLGFRAGNVIPYIQPKLILSSGDRQGVLAFGVRF